MPRADTEAMQHHLDQIAHNLLQSAWPAHASKLRVADNLSLLPPAIGQSSLAIKGGWYYPFCNKKRNPGESRDHLSAVEMPDRGPRLSPGLR